MPTTSRNPIYVDNFQTRERHFFTCHVTMGIVDIENCCNVPTTRCNSSCPAWARQYEIIDEILPPVEIPIPITEPIATVDRFEESMNNLYDQIIFNPLGRSIYTTPPLSCRVDTSFTPGKINKKRTPEERYREMRKNLGRALGIKKMKVIDGIMKPYLELRDEELLRKILNNTKDIRVCHEMRNWIEDYIIMNK